MGGKLGRVFLAGRGRRDSGVGMFEFERNDCAE